LSDTPSYSIYKELKKNIFENVFSFSFQRRATSFPGPFVQGVLVPELKFLTLSLDPPSEVIFLYTYIAAINNQGP